MFREDRLVPKNGYEIFENQKIMLDLKRDNVSYDDHPGYKYCSKNTWTYVCPNSPYGTAQGWEIASGN